MHHIRICWIIHSKSLKGGKDWAIAGATTQISVKVVLDLLLSWTVKMKKRILAMGGFSEKSYARWIRLQQIVHVHHPSWTAISALRTISICKSSLDVAITGGLRAETFDSGDAHAVHTTEGTKASVDRALNLRVDGSIEIFDLNRASATATFGATLLCAGHVY